MNHDQKLNDFAERTFAEFFDKLIISDTQGGIIAFGRYRIVPDRHQFIVERPNQDPIRLGTKKTAISWCIADNHRQYNLANNILLLDNKREMLRQDIESRRQVANRNRDTNFADCINNKVQRKIGYLQAVNSELEKCLYSAKYIQIRGFSNETARTIHTFQGKTNRQGV